MPYDYGRALGEIKTKVESTYRADRGLPPDTSSQRQETAAILLLLIHWVLKGTLNLKGVMIL